MKGHDWQFGAIWGRTMYTWKHNGMARWQWLCCISGLAMHYVSRSSVVHPPNQGVHLFIIKKQNIWAN